MGLFNFKRSKQDIKAKIADSANRISGRLDFLQGCVSLSALVMAADGEIEAKEIEMLTRSIKSNDTLNAAYTGAQIDEAIRRAITKAQQGRTGKRDLWKEVEDLTGDPDAETVLLIALDVADSDGDMEDEEMVVLKKAAGILNLNLDSML